MAFFRYPGGKTKLRKKIVGALHELKDGAEEYREPFFGGGVIGLQFMKESPEIQRAWFNDYDIGLSLLWTSVLTNHERLMDLVLGYTPKVEDFYVFKEELLALSHDEVPIIEEDRLLVAFKKLAIHQISYSGLGTQSGSPLGGKKQESKYKIDCRWSPEHICKKIKNIHKECGTWDLRTPGCTCLDFEPVIAEDSCPALIYVDPPYFDKGGELYQHSFTTEDHERLAEALQNTRHKWVLSYDDCPKIRDLYSWAIVEEIKVNYTINQSRMKGEVLIRN